MSQGEKKTDANGTSGSPPAASFEQALARLETIVHDLEEGQVGLAESLARYEEGVGLLKNCYQMLESAERRIELCTGMDAEGNPITEPFDDSAASASLEEKAQSRARRRSQPAKSPRTAKAAEDASASGSTSDDETEIDEPRGLF